MKVLFIGGSRFVGWHAAARLIKEGHALTFLRRGSFPPPFPGVPETLGDRALPATWARLPRRASWDMAVDCCAYTAADTRLAVKALAGRVGRYVNIGTGQVYLVLNRAPTPSREGDFKGPTMPPPPGPERGAWRYGMDKRACEETLAEAGERGFPFTTLRLPVVQGPRDHKFRLHAYVRRVLDGGPILLPKERSGRLRHLFVKDAAALVAGLLRTPAGLGKAYNLAMEEDDVTLPALCAQVYRSLGREPRVRQVPRRRLAAAGIPEESSPLSGSWISFMDPGLARRELGFRTTPWKEWLAETVRWTASDLGRAEPGYEARTRELALVT